MIKSALCGILLTVAVTTAAAQEKNVDQNIAAQTVPGVGRAEARVVKYKDAIGIVSSFTRADGQSSSCSGTCYYSAGTAANAWACSSSTPSCQLDCTTRPPTKSCR